jgi:acetyltransferase-like isoleucine patch superfamily enzyme
VVIKFPNDIEIGDHVTINQFCYIVGKGGLQIGNYTMIGAGSKITTTSHEFHDISKPMAQQGISVLPIVLEEDIWLGFNVVLVGGVQIGKGSIAAAGSVVLGKSYPPYSILGGVPASIIRSRLDK